jgi:hypothetical protein
VWQFSALAARRKNEPSVEAGTTARPTASIAVEDESRAYRLYTHCGIEWAWIDDAYWRTDGPLRDGQSPPAGWGNPFQDGTLTMVSESSADFESTAGSVTFHRTELRDQSDPPFVCQ